MTNALYAQSGGVTAVINNTARAVIETARRSGAVSKVYGARFGIVGALREELVDTSHWDEITVRRLGYSPGGAFGSCRFKLGDMETHVEQYRRLIDVCRAHDIRYFFYNGGGDSADTAFKVSQLARDMDFPMTCVGIPKTVDNDLPVTDCCPGFGSAARYLTLSLREASLDVQSMMQSSTRVFIMEVMGRHAGWLAAATGVLREEEGDAPHVILLPEIPFDNDQFLHRVREAVATHGYCCVVASEGTQDKEGRFLSEAGGTDAFGHVQLGGLAPLLAKKVNDELRLKTHWAVPDYFQRSARHAASLVDWEQAYAVGKAAVEMAIGGRNAKIPVIRRVSDSPYQWDIVEADLGDMANVEKKIPREFISEDGFGITEAARRYFAPLMEGAAPANEDGLTYWPRWPLNIAEKKLPDYQVD